jgi:hypothetical protein
MAPKQQKDASPTEKANDASEARSGLGGAVGKPSQNGN